MNPAFAARLRELGAVQPNPAFSHSSVAGQPPPRGSNSEPSTQFQSPPPPSWPAARDNATLGVLEARRRLEEQAEAELENMGRATRSDGGRELLDVGTIRRVLLLRRQGVGEREIEERFGLRPGTVRRLGPPGTVEAVQVQLSQDA